MEPISLSNLPRDVILGVLEELRPVGPVTAYESCAEKPMVSPGHLDCRTSLLNVCLASRAFHELAIPYLYRHPLVNDRLGLYRFFCALARQADRRPMVWSFAWAGVLCEDEPDAISSLRHLEDEAVSSAEDWNSIKDEWPHDPFDLEIAKLSKYEALKRIVHFAPVHTRSPSCRAPCTRILVTVHFLFSQRHSQKFHRLHPSRSRLCKPTCRTSGGFVMRILLCLLNITDSLLRSGY